MGADVDPGQADGRDRDNGESPPGRSEAGKGGGAQSDGDTSVPGQVSEPCGFATTAARARQQGGRPRPAHHLLYQLGQCPGAGAACQQAARQLGVACQPRRPGRRRGGAESAELHNCPGGRMQGVRQAVDRAEHLGLTRAHPVAAYCQGRDKQRHGADAQADLGVGQRADE